MHKINPKKLLNSKWTAVSPKQKEKHFMVTDIEFDEEGHVIQCIIEAVLTKRAFEIEWFDLKNEKEWVFGWK